MDNNFNIIIDKPLTILGENFPLIDGQEKGEIITITSDEVIIDGLHIINVGTSYTTDYAAIRVIKAKNFIIRNVKLDRLFFGIYLEKAPQYSLQGHLIYSLAKGQWVSLSANYFIGGENRKKGVDANDEQDNSCFGLTYSLALNQQHSLKFYANTGVITRIGNDFDSFGLLWQSAF